MTGPMDGIVNSVKLNINLHYACLKVCGVIMITEEWIIIGECGQIFSKKGGSRSILNGVE